MQLISCHGRWLKLSVVDLNFGKASIVTAKSGNLVPPSYFELGQAISLCLCCHLTPVDCARRDSRMRDRWFVHLSFFSRFRNAEAIQETQEVRVRNTQPFPDLDTKLLHEGRCCFKCKY